MNKLVKIFPMILGFLIPFLLVGEEQSVLIQKSEKFVEYFNKSDYRNALAMCEYQKMCAPDPSIKAFNARDAGMCHFLLENYSDAMLDLTEYLDSEYSNNSSAEDRARILDLREQARLRLAL